MNDPDCLSDPDFRATIAGDRVTLVAWHPGLIGPWGPCNAHLRARDRAGVGIADLTVIREPGIALELIVKFHSGGPRADVRNALVGWAGSLGYGRIWLPDEVVDLDGAPLLAGEIARTRFRACRTRWEDGDQDFWLSVRRWGVFPMTCSLCGGDLPQWEVVHRPDEQRATQTHTRLPGTCRRPATKGAQAPTGGPAKRVGATQRVLGVTHSTTARGGRDPIDPDSSARKDREPSAPTRCCPLRAAT